jgi:hypothetical protein
MEGQVDLRYQRDRSLEPVVAEAERRTRERSRLVEREEEDLKDPRYQTDQRSGLEEAEAARRIQV